MTDPAQRTFRVVHQDPQQIIATITVNSMRRQFKALKSTYGHLPEWSAMLRAEISGEAS